MVFTTGNHFEVKKHIEKKKKTRNHVRKLRLKKKKDAKFKKERLKLIIQKMKAKRNLEN